MWSIDFIDLFFGSGTSGDPEGRSSSFAQAGLSLWANQIPYIGQYVGYYMAGYEDLSELTYVPETKRDGKRRDAFEISSVGDEGDEGGRKRSLIDGAGDFPSDATKSTNGDNPLLRHPGLLADNSSFGLQELSLDTRTDAWRHPLGAHIAEDGVEEVVVRGIRPIRSGSPPSARHYVGNSRRGIVSVPNFRPETYAPDRAERAPPPPLAPATKQDAVTVSEVIIVVERNPEKSDPDALKWAEGRGRIEWGDVVALGRGGWNGLVNVTQMLASLSVQHMAGPLAPVVMPYTEPTIRGWEEYRLSIDPFHARAGSIGEEGTENLVFEALPLIPKLGQVARRALRSDVVLMPVFGFMGTGTGGGSRIVKALTMSERAAQAEGLAARIETTASTSESQFLRKVEELEGQKAVAEDILEEAGILLESRSPTPRSAVWGFSEAEKQEQILRHLENLAQSGNPHAAEALPRYRAALKALGHPTVVRNPAYREIFRDPRWVVPPWADR